MTFSKALLPPVLKLKNASPALIQTVKNALSALAPPPELTVSEWADEYRHLPKYSAIPGRWKTDRAPYQREMMDVINDMNTHTVVIMAGAQVGKSEVLNNAIGYFIDYDPCAMLLIQPTLELAEDYAKQRLEPMFEATDTLRRKVNQKKEKDRDNTIRYKSFPGGFLSMAGANSPASLASKPVRIVLLDEIDRYPASAGTEGDPVTLAERRTATFWNRKKLFTSTPTIKYASRIEKLYEESDMRRYQVPCVHCGVFQVLIFEQVKWNKTPEGEHLPETAHYLCAHCKTPWTDFEKKQAVRRGKWVAEKPFHGVAGFHIWEAYSPFRKLSEIVTDFLKAKDDPLLLKAWTNTSEGKTWEEQGLKVNPHNLFARREKYAAEVPWNAVVLTAGVDVQGDRLEVEVKGWGIGEESWGIAYEVLWGDPAEGKVWQALDDLLGSDWQHESGVMLGIAACCIDSGGNKTQSVYEYCRGKQVRNIFAIKGVAGIDKAMVSSPSKKTTGQNRRHAHLYTVGVDQVKALVYGRLDKTEPGPGYYHFPEHYTEQYFSQLTAETRREKLKMGFTSYEWIKLRANEALDCNVYAYAALKILNPSFEAYAERLPRKPGTEDNSSEQTPFYRPLFRGIEL